MNIYINKSKDEQIKDKNLEHKSNLVPNSQIKDEKKISDNLEKENKN